MLLFNKSIELGEIPHEWKISAVNPIHKSKEKDKANNYRPISLLSILSKLLERHIHKLFLKHLDSVAPLAAQQWGFRPGWSTISALLDATHEWFQPTDDGKEVCTIFFDLKKAFDSVPPSSSAQEIEVRWAQWKAESNMLFLMVNTHRSNQFCPEYLKDQS